MRNGGGARTGRGRRRLPLETDTAAAGELLVEGRRFGTEGLDAERGVGEFGRIDADVPDAFFDAIDADADGVAIDDADHGRPFADHPGGEHRAIGHARRATGTGHGQDDEDARANSETAHRGRGYGVAGQPVTR